MIETASQTTATLDPERQQQAKEYARIRRRLFVVELVIGGRLCPFLDLQRVVTFITRLYSPVHPGYLAECAPVCPGFCPSIRAYLCSARLLRRLCFASQI